MSLMDGKCITCKFWNEQTTIQEMGRNGFCRRYAPRATVNVGEIKFPEWKVELAVWPRTLSLEWCGEFIAKSV